MRAAVMLLAGLALAVGCRNQTSSITNPFLTPDRVPPPATRFPAPGAAQPYYAGDPLAAPIPGVAAPSATYAPPAGTYPAAPPSTFDAGAASALPPAASYPAAAPLPTTSAPAAVPYAAPYVAPTPSAAPVTPPGGWGTYPPQSALPFVPQPQQLRQREITQAEFVEGAAGGSTQFASATLSSDGFRPQGAGAALGNVTAASTPPATADSRFRSPGVGVSADGAPTAGRFAVGEGYSWLRGQLEYWPESGEWTIRYLDVNQADQFAGRAQIENPQLLGNLPPGEFVMLRGQMFGRQIDDAQYVPTYRVAAVQRQRP